MKCGKPTHIFIVLSGKGGVGKSTTSALLALEFHRQGKRCGILDVDLCGPSIPKLFGCDKAEIRQSESGWVPVYPFDDQSLGIMSIGFLLPSDKDAVVWRGPRKTAMIKQFIDDVAWGDLDVLIIDCPPGTSDEHITVVETLRALQPDGGLLVTTPQAISINDVQREISFCKKVGLPILGILENMSGFKCPNCETCIPIFSMDGGKHLAEHYSLPFLGKIGVSKELTQACDDGSLINTFTELSCQNQMAEICNLIMKE